MKKAALLFVVVVISIVICVPEVFSISLDIGTNINKPVKNFKEIKSQHVVKQTLDYSCGPASLATLLSYYFEDTITEQEIIKYLLLTTDLKKVEERKGFSLLDLKNFAQMRGYKVVGYRMDLEYLVAIDKPEDVSLPDALITADGVLFTVELELAFVLKVEPEVEVVETVFTT